MTLFVLIARLIVASIFVVGALGKFLNFQWFTEVLRGYRLLSERVVGPTAMTVVGMELYLGLSLLFRWRLAASCRAAVALLILFSAVIAITLARKIRDVQCGCNGFAKNRTVSWKSLIHNGGLIALVLVVSGVGRLAMGWWRPIDFLLFVFGLALLAISSLPARLKRNDLEPAGSRER
jgi:hypothetical protein